MTVPQGHNHRVAKHSRLKTTVESANLSDVLFYTAYTVWLVLMITNTSLFSRYLSGVYAGIRMLCLLMLFLKELVDMRTTNTSLQGFAVAVTMVACSLIAADTALVDGIAFIVCGRNKNFTRFAKLSVRITICVVAVVILSSLMGVIKNYYGWSGGRMRYFLGFRYALYPASYLFFTTCAIVYIKGNRLTLPQTIAIIACDVVIFHFTQSRMSFLLSLLVSLLAFVYASRQRRYPEQTVHQMSPRMTMLCSSIFFIAALASFTLVFLYTPSNQLMIALDHSNFLGGRLAISHEAISVHKIGLLGREMHFSGAALGVDGVMLTHEHYDYIDNFYIKIALNYGLVFLLLFLMLQTKLLRNACQEGNHILVVVLIAIALHCILDNAALHLYYNPFLFLMGGLMTAKETTGRHMRKYRKRPSKATYTSKASGWAKR